jgi:hypothetical protein
MELALVAESDGLRGLRDEHAALEQLPSARDSEIRQVLVGRQPHLRAEGANEVKLVERRVLGKVSRLPQGSAS